ncbi:MAG: DegV family protein [Tissierellia bacterium]|nr:DegV family protein [Tissierellia bacterium]
MTEKIAILTDTGGDISVEQARDLNINLVPLHIHFKDRQYLDMIEISPQEVYDRFEEEIPTTSTPSVGEVEQKISQLKEEGYNRFIFVAISSGLSGVYNVFRMAIENTGVIGFVLDTKRIGIISGILAVYAARLRERSLSYKQIVEKLKENLDESVGFYTLKTLKYLVKGGRIGRVKGVLSGILNVKPIISCNEEGIYYTVDKKRGTKKVMLRMAELLRNQMRENYELYLCHGDDREALEEFKKLLKKEIEGARIYRENQITAVLGVHTGPGMVAGMVFTPND